MSGGHGNPNWNYEETLLVYELLLKHHPEKAPGPSSQEVKDLSDYIRNLPYHKDQDKNEKFRNLNSIAMKLQNLNSELTGKGLSSSNKLDSEIVDRFKTDRAKVTQAAEEIRNGVIYIKDLGDQEDDQDEVLEGRVRSRVHKSRERRSLRKKKIKEVKAKNGELVCEECGREEDKSLGDISECIFEVHHVVPISEASKVGVKTKLSDLAVLCACCHRIVHARM